MKPTLRDYRQVLLILLVLCAGVGELYAKTNLAGSGLTAYTGSPGDNTGGRTCIECHGGSNQTNAAKFNFSGMPGGYALSQAYTITLTGVGPNQPLGFQITAERTDTNGKAGSWTAGSNTGVMGSDWVGHTNQNTTWVFTWTAPPTNVGNIKMYVSGPAGYVNGQPTYLANYTITAPPVTLTSLSPTFGSVAEIVTLTGTNFIGTVSTVSFGGVNANCTPGSDTSLTCPVPAGVSAGSISVTVQNANGTSNARTFFAITAAPAPTAASPSFGSSTDTARSVTVTGSSFSKSATAKLTKTGQGDIPATGVAVASTGSMSGTFNLSGAATGQWNIVVTNPDAQPGPFANGFTVQLLPTAPSGPAGVPTGAGTIHWTWTDNADNEDGYRLVTTTGGSVSPALAADTTFYIETGLTGNALTTRMARAYNVIGSADSPAASTYTVTNAPSNPAALVSAETTLTFGWTPNNAPGTTYVAEAASGTFTSFPVVASSVTLSTTAALGPLAANTTHFLRVKARSYDNLDTAYTAEIATPTRANPPAASALTAGTATALELTWSANGNPAGTLYTAQASSSTGFTGTVVSSVTVSTFSTVSSLVPNTTYFVRVRARNHAGIDTAFDTTLTTVTLASVPGTPITVDFGTSTLTVGWNANQNPPDTRFAVELSTNDFGPLMSSQSVTGTQASFSGLTPSTSYWFRVKAIDRIGRESAYTAAALKRTASVALSAPAGVSVAALGTSSITISWSAVTFAVTYNLYVATNTGSPFATGVTTTSFARTGLSANTAYGVRVSAVNADSEEGALSAAATAFTLAQPPTGTLATALSSTSIRASWTPSGASAYAVERSSFSGGGFSQIVSSSALGAASQYADPGRTPATTYFYRVRGFNGDGIATAYDAESSTVTFAPLPGAPSLSGIALSSSSIRWSWVPSGGAASSFTLLTSTGGVVAALAGSATFYVEAGLAKNANFSRTLKAVNATGEVFSNTLTVATPDAAVDVPAAAAATVTGADGSTRLDIPAGALGGAGQAAVSLDPVNAPLVSGVPALIASANAALPGTLKGPASSVREFIAVVGGERFTGAFSAAVTVRIPYPDADSDGRVDGVTPTLAAANLAMYVLDEVTRTWQLLPSTVDSSNMVVIGTVNHLSVFTLLGNPASSSLAGLKVYPNPWRPGSGGPYDAAVVRFKNLTETAEIKVFTITGELVRRLGKTAADGDEKVWDGRNDDGKKVASGVYLFLIRNPGGEQRIGKVAIIR